MQSDETDAALLALLAENARAPVSTLARKLGLARTTVQARIERLETRGVIAGYTLRRGASARALLRATVLISIEPRSQPAVLARLRALPAVEQVHTTSGRFDLITTLSAVSTEALDAALDQIVEAKGVRASESLIHLSTKIDRGG
ncbi:Lrp/AsnC family transcriptional regulator [Aquicoccus sp. G2-2]|uniref:Lrp/AsnC family transcriptional regulator n=1 Tax=Aquicoccus sp. G2-2 TaxID=3092120 RepID=UPI002AE02B8A|nr:Lrp/AsnC family transcriptional regulator [Aquicoccus sp. G2-2]MEA1113826.1 Lrp/AsnC family transcriptional regulator [Aquicoccus sp. G2-2]